MAKRHPLPPELGPLVTAKSLRARSIHHDRLKRSDIEPVIRGFHTPSISTLDLISRARLTAHALPTCCISDTTAARILGLVLPWEVADDDAIHLTQPAGTTRRIRRPGILSHRRELHEAEVINHQGVWVTAPSRIWFDLAEVCSVPSIVQFGDHLIRIPRRRFEGRSAPHATIENLRSVVEHAGRVRGKRKARAALELIRPGADSFRETQLRLAIVNAGLPEPQLQVRLDPDDPTSPVADAAYRDARIALDYDGETHFAPDQWRKDQHRDNRFHVSGWLHLRFNAGDAREDFRRAVQQVRQVLRQRGAL